MFTSAHALQVDLAKSCIRRKWHLLVCAVTTEHDPAATTVMFTHEETELGRAGIASLDATRWDPHTAINSGRSRRKRWARH